MNFPPVDRQEFGYLLYTLFPTPLCTLDTAAAADWLQVCKSTLYRWLNGTQPIPHASWSLVWLIGSGTLPVANEWNHWRFVTRWDSTEGVYIQRLVTPNGEEFSPGEILSWHFDRQRLAALTRQLRHYNQTPSTTQSVTNSEFTVLPFSRHPA